MKKKDKIYVAGHTGLAGSALVRALKSKGYSNLLTIPSSGLDLIDQKATRDFFLEEKPDYVFMVAGKSGSIVSNSSYPAEYIYENLMIGANVIDSAYKAKVKKLLYIGCSCLYPKICLQPMKESYLFTGPFEVTNEAFSTAKLAGLKMCQAYRRQYKARFISCISDTLYGLKDKFGLEDSHVISALIPRFHKARVKNEKEVIIWGSGNAKRGFLYVDDFADACIFLMLNHDSPEPINIGSGEGTAISELAEAIKRATGFKGKLKFDSSKPEGAKEKYLDTSSLKTLGWKSKTTLKQGLAETYQWYLRNI
jgi:GDP-L-fucose synthase